MAASPWIPEHTDMRSFMMVSPVCGAFLLQGPPACMLLP